MAHKVISIEQEEGITTVWFEVPEFTNFGAGLPDLEEEIAETFLAAVDPDDEDGEVDLTDEISALKSELDHELAEARAKHPEFVAMVEETTRELLSLANLSPGQVDGAGSLLFDEEEEQDLPDDALAVCLPDGEAWTVASSNRAEAFFQDWPDYREAVRQAAFEYYCKFHDVFREDVEGDPAAGLVCPEPTDISMIDDRFVIHTIHLRANGDIGLEGECLWDQEHGIGILIRGDSIARAGQAEVAFA